MVAPNERTLRIGGFVSARVVVDGCAYVIMTMVAVLFIEVASMDGFGPQVNT